MPAVEKLDISHRLGLTESGAGDRGLPAIAFEDRQRLLVHLQGDHPLGADQPRAERHTLGPTAFLGIKIQRDTALRLIARPDLSADDRPHPLVARVDVGLRRGTSLDEDGRLAGDGRAGEEGRQVEAVTAQDPEIKSAAALVLLAAHADFLEFTDLTRRDQLLHDVEDGVITVAMRDGEFHTLLRAELHHLVGFRQGADEGLLDIDALHAGGDGRHDHRVVFMDVAGADRDQVGPDLGQQGLIIREGPHPTQFPGLGRPPLRVRIGDGDHRRLRHLEPDQVFPMTIITLPRMPDDRDGQAAAGGLRAQERGGQGERGGSEEVAAMHVSGRSEGSSGNRSGHPRPRRRNPGRHRRRNRPRPD